MEIPKHFKKFVADYQAGKITAEDITMTGDPKTPLSLEFEITLPTSDQFGDPNGSHTFKVGVESLLSTRQLVNAEADAVIAGVDEFNAMYDTLLIILDEIKTQKKIK